MSGINNEYNEQEIAGSVTAGTSMFSDLFRRFGQPPMVVPEADEECRTYYQEILHIKAQLEQIDASNRGIDRIVVNADGTLTVYYSDGTTYTSPSLKGADGHDGQDGQDGAPGQDGQNGTDGVSPTIDVVTVTGGHRVDITDAQGSESFTVLDGQNGVTPDITATATVDNTPGVAEVSVVKSGTDANPIFAFNFVHLKGNTGAQGLPGQDGVSPTAYVTQTGQNEVTITVIDANGTTTATLTGEAGAPGRDGQDGRDGEDGEDGVSPVITVTDITGGHRVTISDADGTQSFDVLDGTPGQNGTNGQDGVSPMVTVSDITGGHQVSITDASSTQTFNVMDGTPGQNGVSPTIDVVTVTGGHRVDITDAQGSESFTVLDGQDGVTPDISMSATADATSSANPTVTVTKGGTTANPTFALAFSGLKGQPGQDAEWPAGGSVGDVLTKGVSGVEWQTPSGGGGGLELIGTYNSGTLGSVMVDLRNKCSSGVLSDGDDIVIFGNLQCLVNTSAYPIKISTISLSSSASLSQDANAPVLEIPHMAQISYDRWGEMKLTGYAYAQEYTSGGNHSARLYNCQSDSSSTNFNLMTYMSYYMANSAVEFITRSNTQTSATVSIAVGQCSVRGITIYKVKKS